MREKAIGKANILIGVHSIPGLYTGNQFCAKTSFGTAGLLGGSPSLRPFGELSKADTGRPGFFYISINGYTVREGRAVKSN